MELDNKNKLKAEFNPKVSIVIPVFNGSDYLNEAIESALAQTYKNIEIIVVNDGSTDAGRTENIALSYGDKIKYFRKENGGVATALNLGIKEMTGEYFSWLSHDDMYFPHKVEAQVNVLSEMKNKEVYLFSDFEFIDESGKHLSYFRVEEEFRNHFGLCVLFNQIHGCTVLMHKNILSEIHGFTPKYLTTQDYRAWIEVFKKGFPAIHIRETLVKSRLHKDQGTKVMSEISATEIQDLEKDLISNITPQYPTFQERIRLYYKAKNISLYKFFLDIVRKNEKSFIKVIKLTYLITRLSVEDKVKITEIGNISKASHLLRKGLRKIEKIGEKIFK